MNRRDFISRVVMAVPAGALIRVRLTDPVVEEAQIQFRGETMAVSQLLRSGRQRCFVLPDPKGDRIEMAESGLPNVFSFSHEGLTARLKCCWGAAGKVESGYSMADGGFYVYWLQLFISRRFVGRIGHDAKGWYQDGVFHPDNPLDPPPPC